MRSERPIHGCFLPGTRAHRCPLFRRDRPSRLPYQGQPDPRHRGAAEFTRGLPRQRGVRSTRNRGGPSAGGAPACQPVLIDDAVAIPRRPGPEPAGTDVLTCARRPGEAADGTGPGQPRVHSTGGFDGGEAPIWSVSGREMAGGRGIPPLCRSSTPGGSRSQTGGRGRSGRDGAHRFWPAPRPALGRRLVRAWGSASGAAAADKRVAAGRRAAGCRTPGLLTRMPATVLAQTLCLLFSPIRRVPVKGEGAMAVERVCTGD